MPIVRSNPTSIQVTSTGNTASLTLSFDAATPHQLSVKATQTRTLATGSAARVEYKIGGTDNWIVGGNLYQVKTSENSSFQGFSGWIVDLNPGTNYDVRVVLTEPGLPVAYAQGSSSTRSLPAEGAAQTKTCTPATFSSALSGAVAGDVIVMQAGTYNVNSNFSWAPKGTATAPIVLRGVNRESVIWSTPSGYALQFNGNNTVIESITFRGSQVDAGTGSNNSVGMAMSGNIKTNLTVRHCTFMGFDIGIKAWDPIHGFLLYDNEFIGNNTWDKAYTIQPSTGYATATWNDTGVGMPGQGNCAWNNSFTGFGDTFKLGDQSHAYESRACYMHHNLVKRAGDDGFEFDDMGGNCAAYNNIVVNSATAASFDGINGGPVGFFRNICINQTRGPYKLTSSAAGLRIYNNTIICTTKQTDIGLYAASSQIFGFDYRNNILIYRGNKDLINFNSSIPGAITDYNAWYPDNRLIYFGSGSGSFTGLTTAKAGLTPRMAHDVIVASNPFTSAITLGADYTTEYLGTVSAILASGPAKNGGVAIPGVTDGFIGSAPDMGAVISGQNFGTVGCSWQHVTV